MKTYTLSELKSLVLGQVNKIKELQVAFEPSDADQAYDEAVRECGFELPADDDDNLAIKYHWLILRMRRWFFGRLWEQHVLMFKAGDLEAQQMFLNFQKICQKFDDDFRKAKEDDATSFLFVDGMGVFFTDMVVGTGFKDDAAGQPMETQWQ